MNTAPLPEFLILTECAELIRLAPTTVYQLVHEGLIPVRKHGRRLVFLRSEIMEWSAARAKKPKVTSISKFQAVQTRLRSINGHS